MVQIDGRLVRLREFRADDLDASLRVVGDERVTRWLSFDALNRDQQAERLAAAIRRSSDDPRNEWYLAVTERNADEPVGFVRIGLSGVRAGKLGYAVAADQWNRGYATDAARTMTTFAFTVLGLHRITAAVGPDNAASFAVLKRLGFTREGRLRDHVFTNGAWRDSELYSVLAHEWTAT